MRVPHFPTLNRSKYTRKNIMWVENQNLRDNYETTDPKRETKKLSKGLLVGGCCLPVWSYIYISFYFSYNSLCCHTFLVEARLSAVENLTSRHLVLQMIGRKSLSFFFSSIEIRIKTHTLNLVQHTIQIYF